MNEQAHHSPGTLGRPVAVMYVNVLDFTVASGVKLLAEKWSAHCRIFAMLSPFVSPCRECNNAAQIAYEILPSSGGSRDVALP
jgi:hypothetical protein